MQFPVFLCRGAPAAGGHGESIFHLILLARAVLIMEIVSQSNPNLSNSNVKNEETKKKSSEGGKAEGREFPTVPKFHGMNSQLLQTALCYFSEQSKGSESKPQNKEQNSEQFIKKIFFFHFTRMLNVLS